MSQGKHHGALESVAAFGSPAQANLCRMALAEAGIEAWLSTEHLSGVHPALGLAIGVDVMVRPEMASSARELLAALESGTAEIPEETEPLK